MWWFISSESRAAQDWISAGMSATDLPVVTISSTPLRYFRKPHLYLTCHMHMLTYIIQRRGVLRYKHCEGCSRHIVLCLWPPLKWRHFACHLPRYRCVVAVLVLRPRAAIWSATARPIPLLRIHDHATARLHSSPARWPSRYAPAPDYCATIASRLNSIATAGTCAKRWKRRRDRPG
jgi:hypothetical protein